MRVLKGLVLVVGMVLGNLAGNTVHAESIDVNGVQIAVMDYEKMTEYRMYNKKYGMKWTTVDAYYNYTDAYKCIDAVNAYRAEKGLDPLPTNDHLMQIAMERALECNVLSSHKAPYGASGDAAWSCELGHAFGWCEVSKNIMDREGDFKYGSQEFVGGFSDVEWNDDFSLVEGWKDWCNSIALNYSVLDPTESEWCGIAVGMVNGYASFLLFDDEECLNVAPDSRISDYRVSVQVPVNKLLLEVGQIYDNGQFYDSMIGDSPIIGEVEVGVRLDDGYYAWMAEKKELLSTAVQSVKLSKKRFGKKTKVTVKFGKTKGTGYEIQYSTKKSMTGAKTVKSKSTKKSFSIKGKGKKIWVRVRLVNEFDWDKWNEPLGDYGFIPNISDDVYGKWSKPVSIKTYK